MPHHFHMLFSPMYPIIHLDINMDLHQVTQFSSLQIFTIDNFKGDTYLIDQFLYMNAYLFS